MITREFVASDERQDKSYIHKTVEATMAHCRHAKSEAPSLGFAFENVTMRTAEPMASAGSPFAPNSVIHAWGPLRKEAAETGDWPGWRRGVEGWRGGGGWCFGGACREVEAEGPRFTAVSLDFCTTHQNSAACRQKLGGRPVLGV